MAGKKTSPADFTGRQRDRLADQHADELRDREQHMSMATAVQVELDDAVTDVSSAASGGEAVVMEDGGEIVVDAPTRVVRVNTTLEDVTIGYGNNYSFVEGRQYRVPANVAEHLEALGYVWH